MNIDYIGELNKTYNEFYCKNGKCKCFEDCKPNNDYLKFYSDRVKIGEFYGEKYPKILFVGLEGVYEGSEYRVPEINREFFPSLDAQNNHYRGVRYVLSYILSKFEGGTPPNSAQIDDLNKPEYTKHLKYYCLTNIYKCAFSEKRSGLPHSKDMKEKCYKILIGEIEALRPDIVVIQAKTDVPKNLWPSLYKNFFDNRVPVAIKKEGYTSCYEMKYKDDNKPFFVLYTYHGNGRPFPKGKGGVFVNNKKYIKECLNPVLDELIKKIH